jgi:hypothetical protein
MRKVVIATVTELLRKKAFPMSVFKWDKDVSNSWDSFQSYCDVTGCEPISNCSNVKGLSSEGRYEVHYDFTILKTTKGKFIPCHGSIKMPEVDSEIKARSVLAMWMQKEQDHQYTLYLKSAK